VRQPRTVEAIKAEVRVSHTSPTNPAATRMGLKPGSPAQ
jgi:hypothetical protein